MNRLNKDSTVQMLVLNINHTVHRCLSFTGILFTGNRASVIKTIAHCL